MAKSNTSNNPLFRKVRELEEKALDAGIINASDIKTSGAMREEAWERFLIHRKKRLESMIQEHETTGGAK